MKFLLFAGLLAGLLALATAFPYAKDPHEVCGMAFVKCLRDCGGWMKRGCWEKCIPVALNADKKLCKGYQFPPHPSDKYLHDEAEAGIDTNIETGAPNDETPSEVEDITSPNIRPRGDEANLPMKCGGDGACYNAFYWCTVLSYTPGLPCRQICKKRALQLNDICKTCEDRDTYPHWGLQKPDLKYPIPDFN